MPVHIMNVNICDKDGLIQVARTDPFVGELRVERSAMAGRIGRTARRGSKRSKRYVFN